MAFINDLENELNTSVTENGAIGYKTTMNALLDLNFKVPTYRNHPDHLRKDLRKAWEENKDLTYKFLFYLRDIREGIGERDSFRNAINYLANTNEISSTVIQYIEKYGRYDDLFALMDTPLESEMLSFISAKLVEDCTNLSLGKPISLLAKWMPSINTSSTSTRALARKLISKLGLTNVEYRKTLSKLRKYLKVVECDMCANNWQDINYEAVPSLANMRYKDAFMLHDHSRRQAYLDSLIKGEAKINSSVAYPHDIVSKYINSPWHADVTNYDETLEQMWKALPDYVQSASNTLVVRDGSGSMTVRLTANSSVRALDVSTALAIYFSERSNGQYKDKFITFSMEPEIVDLSNCKTLKDKINLCAEYDDCTNTNIEKVFDLILATAVNNKIPQEELPNILIVSDMEFDSCMSADAGSKLNAKLFKCIEDKYAAYNYKLPKLIFWNVNSRTSTIPVIKNDLGVLLVSGFSPAISKMVLSSEIDPYKALINVLLSDRYKDITL